MANLSFKGVLASDGNYYDLTVPAEGFAAPLAVTAPAPAPEPEPEPTPEPEPAPTGTIPLAKSDPRFSTNVAGPTGSLKNGLLTNKSWNQGPAYSSGEPVFACTGNGSDVLTIDKAVIDAREGPRLANDATPLSTVNFNESFINCVGKGNDHADGIQAYSPGGRTLLNVTNSCLRSYTDAEAKSKYGTGFIGSCSLFWADNFQGEVRFKNVLVWGGGRGIAVYADTGTTRVSFEDVFFVPSPDGWTYFDFDIRATGGSLVIDKWINVRQATIVNGVLVPGNLIPKP